MAKQACDNKAQGVSVMFCSFGFRKDGGAIISLLVNDKDYATIELDPKDIKSMYSTVQMAEKGLL